MLLPSQACNPQVQVVGDCHLLLKLLVTGFAFSFIFYYYYYFWCTTLSWLLLASFLSYVRGFQREIGGRHYYYHDYYFALPGRKGSHWNWISLEVCVSLCFSSWIHTTPLGCCLRWASAALRPKPSDGSGNNSTVWAGSRSSLCSGLSHIGTIIVEGLQSLAHSSSLSIIEGCRSNARFVDI